jgi:hypothetical protein
MRQRSAYTYMCVLPVIEVKKNSSRFGFGDHNIS